MKLDNKRFSKGFTIVELLVVIVVIGILASITIVSYTGITNKAKESVLQSDLANGSKQIQIFQALSTSSDYPTAINCPTPAATEVCIKTSGSNAVSLYTYNNTSNPKTFRLEITDSSYYVMQTGHYAVSKITESTAPSSVAVLTGLVGPFAAPTMATGTSPKDVIISGDGLYAYATNASSNTISMYSRNVSTGLLSALTPATIATGGTPYSIVMSSDGAHVYVANNTAATISMYSRNLGTGLLTALTPATIATGAVASDLAISPDGNYVYATSTTNNAVYMFSRNSSTGLLAALTPATIATGSSPRGMFMSSDGNSLYVANSAASNMSMYGRDSVTGLLSALTPATISTGAGPNNITITNDGKSVYVTCNTGIYMYSRNTSTNLLTALTPAYESGSFTVDGSIIVSPDRTTVYATNGTNNFIPAFSRDTLTGLLTHLYPEDGQDYSGGNNTRGLAVSLDGKFVYATNYNSGNISILTRQW